MVSKEEEEWTASDRGSLALPVAPGALPHSHKPSVIPRVTTTLAATLVSIHHLRTNYGSVWIMGQSKQSLLNAVSLYPADAEQIDLNAPHAPSDKAIEAFEVVEHTIKSEILKSRHHWNKHEPRMWSRAEGVSDEDLVAFSVRNDLVEVRSAPTSYGTIILGKIRLPAINDAEGEGYIHVR